MIHRFDTSKLFLLSTGQVKYTRHRKLPLFFSALTVFAVCSRASAESPQTKEPTQVELTLQSAKTAQRAHQWQEALRLYREVWDGQKTYDVAANMAKVELQFNEYRSAVEHLTYALENMPSDTPENARVTVQQLVELASANLGKVLLTVEQGTTIQVDAKPREDWLDRSVLYLDAGVHTISISRSGYDTVERAINIRNGESITVTIILPLKSPHVLIPPPQLPPPVRANKPEGQRESRAPDEDESFVLLVGGSFTLATLGAGISTLVASDRSRQDLGLLKANCPQGCLEVNLMQNQVNLGRTLALINFIEAGVVGAGSAVGWALLRDRNHRNVQRSNLLLIVGGVVAGTGIVTGGLLLRSASSHDSAAQKQANSLAAGGNQNFCAPGTPTLFDCFNVLDERETAREQRSFAITSFSVAGAMLAGTVGYYFWSAPSERSTSTIWPVAGAETHGASIGLRGTF